VKSGGLLRGRIHKRDIKNEDTNDSYKGQKLSKVQEKVKERRKKQHNNFFSSTKKKRYMICHPMMMMMMIKTTTDTASPLVNTTRTHSSRKRPILMATSSSCLFFNNNKNNNNNINRRRWRKKNRHHHHRKKMMTMMMMTKTTIQTTSSNKKMEEEEEEEEEKQQQRTTLLKTGALLKKTCFSILATVFVTMSGDGDGNVFSLRESVITSSKSSYANASTYNYRDENYIENIANSVSSSEGETRKATLKSKVKGENGKKIERCAGQCITTCVRGSFNSTSGPGLGPLTKIQEPFVFKDGFRSRQYCVEECLDYCALKVNKEVASAAPPIALK
jgi:hypothetical protein